MALGKPVLCSNLCSLPEIAGDAAVFFDPRRPEEIAKAIEEITTAPELVASIIRRGYERVRAIGGVQHMVDEYWQVFQSAVNEHYLYSQALHGIHPDGWTENRVMVTYQDDVVSRYAEIEFYVPPSFPYKQAVIKVLDGNAKPDSYKIKRGESKIVRCALSSNNNFIEFSIEPTFQPKAFGLNDDERHLGCLCKGCWIVSEQNREALFVPNT